MVLAERPVQGSMSKNHSSFRILFNLLLAVGPSGFEPMLFKQMELLCLFTGKFVIEIPVPVSKLPLRELESLYSWELTRLGKKIPMAKVRLDQTGKVYIPRMIRKAAGISEGDLLDVQVHDSSVVLRRSRLRIAKKMRGQFKLRQSIQDVDREISRASTVTATRELSEIRRR